MDFDKIFAQRFADDAGGPDQNGDVGGPDEAGGHDEVAASRSSVDSAELDSSEVARETIIGGDSYESPSLAQLLGEREHQAAHRRGFLKGAAAGLLTSAAAVGGWTLWQHRAPLLAPLHAALPGRYPGKVVEVRHAGAVYQGRRDRAVIKLMMESGLTALVGCREPVDAWRSFFQRGDRVGIKVVPVGKPDSISSHEVILEVIEGLRSAGVRLGDILVFDRYKDDFMACNYQSTVPDGVHWEASSVMYDDAQLEIDGQLPNAPKESRIAGYDPDVYFELPYCVPTADVKDDRRFRSHVSRIITQKVDKFISIPVLKDHRSAGVTLSLKNLSHGSVNNVARSHIGHTFATHDGKTLNQCGTFIPAAVSMRPIREKAVLQILDGLVGTYEGGPGAWNSTFATWEYKSLLFATDPVALDHVGWRIIDAKRAQEGLPRVAQMGTDARGSLREPPPARPTEQFHIRQPQHIPLAGLAGLGVFDWHGIRHQKIDLLAG